MKSPILVNVCFVVFLVLGVGAYMLYLANDNSKNTKELIAQQIPDTARGNILEAGEDFSSTLGSFMNLVLGVGLGIAATLATQRVRNGTNNSGNGKPRVPRSTAPSNNQTRSRPKKPARKPT